MSKYIDREKLIKRLEATCDIVCQYSKAQRFVMCGSCGLGSALEVLEDFPAADVQEVKHGRWISLTPPEMRTYETDVYFMCSECKNAVRFIANDLPYEHCPHCLARCEK